MAAPDFILINCNSTARPECVSCGREFLVPLSALSSCQKSPEGTVNLFMKSSAFGAQGCRGLSRFISASMLWADFIDELDGDVISAGEVMIMDNSQEA